MKKIICVLSCLFVGVFIAGCSTDTKTDTIDSSSSVKKVKKADKKKVVEKEKAEEEAKQVEIAKKVSEADTAMKAAEANLSDETFESAKIAIEAIPGGNNELQKRLETAKANLETLKQQALTDTQVQKDTDGNGIPDDSPYNNTTPEERARGAQMEADAQTKYWEAYNNGASADDALAYADGRSDSYTQQQNDAAAQLDQYRADFQAQNGREPTSGEIQSQWLQEQGIE